MVQVTGLVTVAGEAPPVDGVIVFSPVSVPTGGAMRPGTAPFGVSGKYRAGTFKAGDGLLPGKYRISIQCWKTPPSAGGPPEVSYIDDKYTRMLTSGYTLDVEAGGDAIKLDLPLDAAR
ncbi:hypothetical protein Pla175_22070 [Pirellulimonas nuda]|uniref:Carboxypeptidase regulatory-like domain-containing protein n=2 Tax=Pirellulimonas nuda TaxID=2528009 RepID=A0A518DBI6_9BACT|nr:hypothetical protein Pla175_22070 [Pirellulimonas nuda]